MVIDNQEAQSRPAPRPPRTLGPSGPLSRSLSGYEDRPGQLAMADEVERALAEHRVLICEAGTGTGKTLAYLVPAILSGKKVIISTATRALQEQIYTKDIPLIRRVLGLEVSAALMKGLSNYLCLRRFEIPNSPEGATRRSRVGHSRALGPAHRLGRPRRPRGAHRRRTRLERGELVERHPHRLGGCPIISRVLRHPHEARGRGRAHRDREPPPFLRRSRAARPPRGRRPPRLRRRRVR